MDIIIETNLRTMKKIIIGMLFLVIGYLGFAQPQNLGTGNSNDLISIQGMNGAQGMNGIWGSLDQNFIMKTVYKQPTTAVFISPTPDKAQVSINYFDGLGRSIQQIHNQQSATGKDIITHIGYDSFGRQTRDYLPYATQSPTNMAFDANASNNVVQFYRIDKYENTDNPFSDKELESSSLNRTIKQAAPGTDWGLNNGKGHEIKMNYQSNIGNEVRLFKATTTWNTSLGLYDIAFSDDGNYEANQLYKTIIYDENTIVGSNVGTEEFKNKEGQVVLKRTYESQQRYDTYYVYDSYGNLTYVIPPKADGAITNEILNGLCYQYKYDNRNRLVEKKLPGKQWEFIVYDKLDRPVATGPVNSPFKDDTAIGWLITKYDVFGRPIFTGWLNSASDSSIRKIMQDARNAATTIFEGKKMSGMMDGIVTYYSNNVEPSNIRLLTLNYYDDYVYPNVGVVPTVVEGETVLKNVKGLLTGSWTRVLSTNSSLLGETINTFYDSKARPICSHVKNYLGGYTYTTRKLDFIGKTLYTITKHRRVTGDSEITVREEFTYSEQDRLLTHTHQINGGIVQLLVANRYDELGQLIEKNVGNNTGNPLQKVNYSYNIRGWLTEINKIDNLQQDSDPTDLFAFKINYNKGTTDPSIKSLYNGNIAETYWKSLSDGGLLRKYGYQYDGLNRLLNSIYQKSGVVTKAYDENLTYDKNGNIISLNRFGLQDQQLGKMQIDELTYEYKADSPNQLLKVTDGPAGNNAKGFIDGNKTGDDYEYDANGNMTSDKNKNITEIRYNHLNLPTKITFGTNNTIEYIYNATGQKLEKIITENAVVTNMVYLGGFQYKNNVLLYFPTAEGYVNNTVTNGTNSYDYVFNYTDHLGNIRVSYKKNAQNVLEILEETNYYPFGLKHEGYNSSLSTDYKYKYNGKELQDELGLNFYDYGARNYDSAIGRWMNVDPLAEKYYNISSYAYVANNPLRYIDPNGMEIINGETARRQKLQTLNTGYQNRIKEKYNGNTKMTKNDFESKDEYKEYKDNIKNAENAADDLAESIKTEANIKAAIDDFKATDPTNFNLANNLTYKDSDGVTKNLDVTIVSGNASEYGGAVTRVSFNPNVDKSYNSIRSINTTLDFRVVRPISNVLAHEMGHAYNNAKNPAKGMKDTTTMNCQDSENRNTFQSKTAMDWQESYDTKKKALRTKK